MKHLRLVANPAELHPDGQGEVAPPNPTRHLRVVPEYAEASILIDSATVMPNLRENSSNERTTNVADRTLPEIGFMLAVKTIGKVILVKSRVKETVTGKLQNI